MVFSSITFLYYFLPIVLLFYFIVPSRFKNLVLLFCSLMFYFYGEKWYIGILIFSCIINFCSGLLIGKFKNKKLAKVILVLTIIINLGILSYFKYTNFFIENVNLIFNSKINYLKVVMPIGISFFTFQTLSYVVDVYKGKVEATKNIINFSCYVCLFPQLIAGPIVRYSDINKELTNRKLNFIDFGEGITRFIIGLSKKVLIANVIGEMITKLYGMNSLTVVAYILMGIGYSLQIYFDFSGYSDMAIGLGKMFGFHFMENFNYPFIASSITDFWRRWHISLSAFLRDYVYIPLGGNRVNLIKHIRNIFVVWFLTGLWHGAAWNFIIWGVYFGIILILEKYLFKNYLDRHKVFGHIITILLVVISFIIFSANNMKEAFVFIKNMFGFGHLSFINSETIYYFKSYIIVILVAIVGSTPLLKKMILKIKQSNKGEKVIDVLEIVMDMVLLIVVTAFLIDSSFNPFLYFRF